MPINELRSYPRAIREAQTSVWGFDQYVISLAQTDKGSTFEHIQVKLYRNLEFQKQMEEWIRVFYKTKPAPSTGGPLIPGDPEGEAEAIRTKEGIPLLKSALADLLAISENAGIPFEISWQHD